MLKHLISLVFLLMAFCYLHAFSETTVVILPKIKPNISTSTTKKTSKILPTKKPVKIVKIKLSEGFTLPKKNQLLIKKWFQKSL